jgi:hypothetical protein
MQDLKIATAQIDKRSNQIKPTRAIKTSGILGGIEHHLTLLSYSQMMWGQIQAVRFAKAQA